MQAAGGACGVALGRAIVRDVYGPDRLVRMIAWLTMAFALGPMLSVPLSGWLVDGLRLAQRAGVRRTRRPRHRAFAFS